MKTIVFGLMSLLLAGAILLIFKGYKTEKIKVKGKCRLCKKHIEDTVKSLLGVKRATWNHNTEILSVFFNSSKINLDAIEFAIVNAGHDTTNQKGKIEYYSELPGCCKYSREEM